MNEVILNKEPIMQFQKKGHVNLTATWTGENCWHNEFGFSSILSSVTISLKGSHENRSITINIPSGTCLEEKVSFRVEYLNYQCKVFENIQPSAEQLKTIKIAAYILCEKPNGKVMFMNYSEKKISILYIPKEEEILLSCIPIIESGLDYELQLTLEKPFEIKASLIKKEKNIKSQIMMIIGKHALPHDYDIESAKKDGNLEKNFSLKHKKNKIMNCCGWIL